jgi:hypothetical protein
MSGMIFVNLPVANLAASKRFYEAVGFTNNPQFTDDTAACMVWSEVDQRHSAHPRQMEQIHEPPHPARNVKRSDAHPIL